MISFLKNIIDNIKSFFQEEEELLEKPKSLPKAAPEIFEKEEKIITKHLDNNFDKKNISKTEKTELELPFSSKELEKAISKNITKEDKKEEEKIKEINEIPEEFKELSKKNELIKDNNIFFENNLIEENINNPIINNDLDNFKESYFDIVKEMIKKDEDNLLNQDLLHRMRHYYLSKLNNEDMPLHKTGFEELIKRRIDELRSLEHEWFLKYSEMKRLEKNIIIIEEEIDEKINSLKTIIKKHKELEANNEVDDTKAFYTHDGMKIKSISGLKRALYKMKKETFEYHVNNERNDFYNWIKDVFNNKLLAEKIKAVRNKEELIKILEENNF